MAEESLQNEFFDTEYLKADLKGRSVRGGAVTMAAQGVTFFLNMSSTIVLARLLTPQDFGLIAMVTIVTSFVIVFKDLGLSMATVQRARINHAQISTLFWINVALSIGIMAVTAALAPAIAWFYGEPRLTWITLALAGTFIFSGFAIQHQALLRRQMRFGALASIQIVGMSAGIATAIIAAWYSAGYWSLVLMQVARVIVGVIAVWIACPWRPGLPKRGAGVREMLSFGGNLTAAQVSTWVVLQLDKVLLGWVWGARALGLYVKSYGLIMRPIQLMRSPLTQVGLPVLCRLQNEPEKYRRYYLKGLHFITTVSLPLMLFVFIRSREFVLVLLGNQWLDAVDIFRALAPAGLIGATSVATGWVFIPLGRPDRQMRAAFFGAGLTATGFIIGLQWGALGVAVGFSAATVLKRFLQIIYAYKGTPLRFVDFLKSFWPTVWGCFVGICGLALRQLLFEVNNSFFLLLTDGIVFIGFYAFGLCVLQSGRELLKELTKMSNSLTIKKQLTPREG